MSTPAHRPRTARRATSRAERGWELVAGGLAGVGAGCIEASWGLLSLLLIVAISWAFMASMCWSGMSEHGYGVGWSVRAGLVATVIAVGLLGLTLLSPIAGGAAATLGAFKLTRSGLAYVRRRFVLETPRESASVRSDQWKVDREFARLVADLERDEP